MLAMLLKANSIWQAVRYVFSEIERSRQHAEIARKRQELAEEMHESGTETGDHEMLYHAEELKRTTACVVKRDRPYQK